MRMYNLYSTIQGNQQFTQFSKINQYDRLAYSLHAVMCVATVIRAVCNNREKDFCVVGAEIVYDVCKTVNGTKRTDKDTAISGKQKR